MNRRSFLKLSLIGSAGLALTPYLPHLAAAKKGKIYTGYNARIFISNRGCDVLGLGTVDKPYKTMMKGLSKLPENGSLCLFPGTYSDERVKIPKGRTVFGTKDAVIEPTESVMITRNIFYVAADG